MFMVTMSITVHNYERLVNARRGPVPLLSRCKSCPGYFDMVALWWIRSNDCRLAGTLGFRRLLARFCVPEVGQREGKTELADRNIPNGVGGAVPPRVLLLHCPPIAPTERILVDLENLLAELNSERARIDQAISALGPIRSSSRASPEVTGSTNNWPEATHDEPCSPQADIGRMGETQR